VKTVELFHGGRVLYGSIDEPECTKAPWYGDKMVKFSFQALKLAEIITLCVAWNRRGSHREG
jgi:hypothetical protein